MLVGSMPQNSLNESQNLMQNDLGERLRHAVEHALPLILRSGWCISNECMGEQSAWRGRPLTISARLQPGAVAAGLSKLVQVGRDADG